MSHLYGPGVFEFLNENYFNLRLIFVYLIFQVLKTVENLGVSYVKNSEQYTKKLEAEFSSLNFPFRTELVRKHSSYTFLFIYVFTYRGYTTAEILWCCKCLTFIA